MDQLGSGFNFLRWVCFSVAIHCQNHQCLGPLINTETERKTDRDRRERKEREREIHFCNCPNPEPFAEVALLWLVNPLHASAIWMLYLWTQSAAKAAYFSNSCLDEPSTINMCRRRLPPCQTMALVVLSQKGDNSYLARETYHLLNTANSFRCVVTTRCQITIETTHVYLVATIPTYAATKVPILSNNTQTLNPLSGQLKYGTFRTGLSFLFQDQNPKSKIKI